MLGKIINLNMIKLNFVINRVVWLNFDLFFYISDVYYMA